MRASYVQYAPHLSQFGTMVALIAGAVLLLGLLLASGRK